VKIKDLCDYEMGPTSTANIWCAREYAEQGFDGLIHIKSANCTPEIDIMPVLQNISTEYKIPILYLTFDSQTSDVGLMTRLEAFYDMIQMRKRNV
jgi:benzoyl-CoA reductase/2-hydroxyglutaryl-CoA dehydratase subunit BcrC/BadD/HgdB